MGRFERGLAKASLAARIDPDLLRPMVEWDPAAFVNVNVKVDDEIDEDLDEYLTRRLRHALNQACEKHGLPSSGWCGICGDNHLPDLDCPMDIDEVLAMDGLA